MTKIFVFSMGPLFPDRSHGGSQKQLRKILMHLAETGCRVTVACTRHPDSTEKFSWHPNCVILPVFHFKMPFPDPYNTPVYNIANAIQATREYLDDADYFYLHDGGLLFPYVWQDTPTTVSLRSIAYSETLISAFHFQGDSLILPSAYARDVYLHTAGRFLPQFEERTHVVHNGFDWEIFQPTATDAILRRIPLETPHEPVILFPHRPEKAKGIFEALEVVHLLVRRHKLAGVRLLVPQWMDRSPEGLDFYAQIQDAIERLGISRNVVFHGWLPDAVLPSYYSLGKLTLCIGSSVETFGNVVFESLGCGTPVIMAKVGPYRDLIPDELAYKVNYNDLEAAASVAAGILQRNERVAPETFDYLSRNYSLDGMVEQYASIITGQVKREPLRFRSAAIDDRTRWRLAPWCCPSRAAIYHDLRAEYRADALLLELLKRHSGGFTFEEADRVGMERRSLLDLYDKGYVVPIVP